MSISSFNKLGGSGREILQVSFLTARRQNYLWQTAERCASHASKHWGLFLLLMEAPRPPGLVSTQLFLWSGLWSLSVTCFFLLISSRPTPVFQEAVLGGYPLAVNTPMWGPCVGIQAKMTDCQKTQYTFLGGIKTPLEARVIPIPLAVTTVYWLRRKVRVEGRG